MVNIITIAIWMALTVWYYLSDDRGSVFGSPRATIAVYYLTFTVAALFFDSSYPIFAEGLLWIAAGTLLFWVGASIKAAPPVLFQPPQSVPRPTLWLATIICTVVGTVGVIDLNESTLGAVTAGQDLDSISGAVSAQLAGHYNQYETANYVRSFGHALLPFLFSASMLAGLLFSLYPHRRLEAAALGLVVPFASVALSGNRTMLVLAFIFFQGSVISAGLYRTHTDTVKLMRLALSVLMLVAVVSIAYFWRWGRIDELESGSFFDRLETGWNAIEMGGFAPLPQFSEWLTYYWTSDNSLWWGARLFRGPAGLLGSDVPRIFEPWIVGPRWESANIFSINRVLIEDFGLPSIAFYFGLGFLARYFRDRTLGGSLIAASFLGMIYATIFYSVIDSPFVHTVTLSALIITPLCIWMSARVDQVWWAHGSEGLIVDVERSTRLGSGAVQRDQAGRV